MEESRVFLEHSERKTIAAFSADMIGASREQTGAWPLLERDPDPGALEPLPPDEHTAWGASRVRAEMIRPNGLSIIARVALRDTARICGGWETAEHPWEGGSDHDVFLREGIPAVLFWHFTDFAYHTNLDRMEHVDVEAARRMIAALLSAALAVADPRPEDLGRYLECLRLDQELRVAAARKAKKGDLRESWERWFDGAQKWLEKLCASSG